MEVELKDLTRLKLAPGDILVMRSEGPLSQDQVAVIKRLMVDSLEAAGLANQVWVLDGRLELAVLSPEPSASGEAEVTRPRLSA
jgi:hypothetical protein